MRLGDVGVVAMLLVGLSSITVSLIRLLTLVGMSSLAGIRHRWVRLGRRAWRSVFNSRCDVKRLVNHSGYRLNLGSKLLLYAIQIKAVLVCDLYGVIGGQLYSWKTTTIKLTKLIAIPRWPNLPDRPIRCRYVSAFLGKSKLITTLTAWISIPRVRRSREKSKQPHHVTPSS
jgi:hypothetical protein